MKKYENVKIEKINLHKLQFVSNQHQKKNSNHP